NFTHGDPTETVYRVFYAVAYLVYPLLLAIILRTYRLHPAQRPRVRWVMLGALWGLPCFLLADLWEATAVFEGLRSLGVYLPQWALTLLDAQSVWFPVLVVYAILRHRVINVRFVISRALVFTVLIFVLGAVVHLVVAHTESLLMHRYEWLEHV